MRWNRRGFTIIELMVVIAIFMVIMATLFAGLTVGRKTWFSGSTSIELQWELRKVKDFLIRDLSQARAGTTFSIPAGGALIPGANTLQFSIPSTLDNIVDNMVPTGDWAQITYFLDATDTTQLIRTEGGIQKVVANRITAISFTPDVTDPRLINVAIAATKQNEVGQTISYPLVFDVKPRN